MDLSLEEIMNLSEDVVKDKERELSNKHHNALARLSMLRELKEKGCDLSDVFNLNGSIYSTHQEGYYPLSGDWSYEGEVNKVSDLFGSHFDMPRNNKSPQKLFFGETVCSDGTSKPLFELDNKRLIRYEMEDGEKVIKEGYQYFFFEKDKIVLYELDGNPKSFRLYRRLSHNGSLTDDDVRNIYKVEVENQYLIGNLTQLNPNKSGLYNMYDRLLDDEVKNYDGKKKQDDVRFIIPNMFTILDIKEDGTCYIMKEGDTLTIRGKKEKDTVINREVSKIRIMENSQDGSILCLKGGLRDNSLGKYRKIGNDEYMFFNLDLNTQLSPEIYVFKKEK